MMQQSWANSYLFGGNAAYVEELYEAYLDNPGSVAENWRGYFDRLQHTPAAAGSRYPHWRTPRGRSFAQRPARLCAEGSVAVWRSRATVHFSR